MGSRGSQRECGCPIVLDDFHGDKRVACSVLHLLVAEVAYACARQPFIPKQKRPLVRFHPMRCDATSSMNQPCNPKPSTLSAASSSSTLPSGIPTTATAHGRSDGDHAHSLLNATITQLCKICQLSLAYMHLYLCVFIYLYFHVHTYVYEQIHT